MKNKRSSKHFIEFKVINEIVKAITTSFNLDGVGQSIVDSIVKYLHSPGGTLLLTDDERGVLYAHSSSNTPIIRKILIMLKKSLRKHVFQYKKEPMTLLGRTVVQKKIFQSEKYEDFLSPEIPELLAHLIQKLARVKLSASLPVIFKEKVLGVLFISFYEENLSKERMAELSIFADHAAIAINNAAKYKELQEKYKELNRRYEMERDTISILSHELKTPLTIAHNAAYSLQDILDSENEEKLQQAPFPKIKKYNTSIVDAINRMQEISNSVLTLREVESRELSLTHELDIKPQVLPLIENFKRSAQQKGIQLHYNFSMKEGKYYGGGVQFCQLVAILLDNAVKYTDEGGTIDIEIVVTEKSLSCTVTDTGIGIPKNMRKLIFRRFYRQPKSQNIRGLGLGLYIAQKIVQQIKGTIEVKPNPAGRGSRFIVEIPIYKIRKL